MNKKLQNRIALTLGVCVLLFVSGLAGLFALGVGNQSQISTSQSTSSSSSFIEEERVVLANQEDLETEEEEIQNEDELVVVDENIDISEQEQNSSVQIDQVLNQEAIKQDTAIVTTTNMVLEEDCQ